MLVNNAIYCNSTIIINKFIIFYIPLSIISSQLHSSNASWNMMVILLFMVLCFTVGAIKQHEVSDDEIERVLNYLNSVGLKDESNILNPNKETSSKWYPRESSTSNPEESWSSTTEYTTINHSEDQPDECEEYGYCKQPVENEYEQEYPVQVGPVHGIPGINFPNYKDIPLTRFRCSDKVYIPGYYADMETGCQVFHVCWPHRRESLLCPVGSIFNQATLACNYWYSSNCSLASHYYDINAVAPHTDPDYKKRESLVSMFDSLLKVGKSDSTLASSEDPDGVSEENIDLSEILKFLPVKAKVFVYRETAESSSKTITEASVGKSKFSNGVEQARHETEIHEAESDFIGVPEKVTVNPHRPHGKKAPVQKIEPTKTKHQHPEMDRIVDRILRILKNLLKDAEGSLSVVDNGQTVIRKSKESTSNKLNPRFITKPAKLPKRHQGSIRFKTKTPEVQKPHTLSRPRTKV